MTAVLKSGWIGMGPQTIAFEQDLAQFLGAHRAVAVSSCTGALFLSLLCLGIGPGDDVICPSLTWCSTANSALYLGARPVFCDVAAGSMSMNVDAVLAALTPAAKAVIVVHYGGAALDVSALRAALPDHVAIVEDCAHALGARYPDGMPVGSSGNLCCFSFYANKNLSTAEGGAVVLNDDKIADHLASLRQHGLNSDAWSRYSRPQSSIAQICLSELGYKLNYTDLQAALGRVQLRRQPEFAAHRMAVAEIYRARFQQAGLAMRFQDGAFSPDHARHLLAVELPLEQMRMGRDELVAQCRSNGIGISIHYPPLHAMPLYQWSSVLPQTERLAQRIITLPIGAAITTDEAEICAQAVIKAAL